MPVLFWIISSTLVISACALIGILTLSLKDEFLTKILTRLVALSSGALLGGALGGRLAGRVKPSTLRWVVVSIGLVVSIIFFIRG